MLFRSICNEDPQFTHDYHDPEKRSIANAVTVHFKDGSSIGEIKIEYPIGHKRRRNEGMPLLIEKFKKNLARIFDTKEQSAIEALFLNYENFLSTPVTTAMDLLVKK